MKWSEGVSMGVKGLLLRKLRSLLSTLGIVFGVAAVISMVSIGEGARIEAIEQIELLGTNTIRVKHLELTGEMGQEAAQSFSRGLTRDDVQLIRERLSDAEGIAPLRFVDAEARFEGREAIAQIVGTSPEHEKVTNFRAAEGRFLTDLDVYDSKNVCIVGSEVAGELFGWQSALGARLRIGTGSFTVVGVMESKSVREGRAAAVKVRNINRDIYIPITTSLRRFPVSRDPLAIDEFVVQVARADGLQRAADEIQEVLHQQHREAEDYEILIPEELLAQAQRTQRLFNVIMASVAGISLLVGGIGIMNIMLANVSERTREIGIRRAIGATKVDVMMQFLIETVLICLAGGVIGIVVGAGMGKVITLYAGWRTVFSFLSIVIAFGTATTIGIIFGLFPARRAAELDPVRAIRFE
jgi:putative ABC transport system permease protein